MNAEFPAAFEAASEARQQAMARLAAEHFLDQAEESLGRMSDAAHELMRFLDQSSSVLKSWATEFQLGAIGLAEMNIGAGFDYMRQILKIDSPVALLALNRRYLAAGHNALIGETAALALLVLRKAGEASHVARQGLLAASRDWSTTPLPPRGSPDDLKTDAVSA